jgi:hypothetical protein
MFFYGRSLFPTQKNCKTGVAHFSHWEYDEALENPLIHSGFFEDRHVHALLDYTREKLLEWLTKENPKMARFVKDTCCQQDTMEICVEDTADGVACKIFTNLQQQMEI